MTWQPIETAPKDGTLVLVCDHECYATGYHEWEPETVLDGRFLDHVPNPKYGTGYWVTVGASAFDKDALTFDHDGPRCFQPTHWAPKLEPAALTDLPTSPALTLDYRKLLIKYMSGVIEADGVSYIEYYSYSEQDRVELKKIEEEAVEYKSKYGQDI